MSALLARLGEGLQSGLAAMTTEVRANPRARLGLAAIGLVLLVALGLRVADHASRRQSEIAALRVHERELANLASPDQANAWQEADRRLAAELQNARDQLWSNAPVGAAHANFYAWIEELTRTSGFQGANVRLGEARRIGPQGELTEMRVSVFVPQVPGATTENVHGFLSTLATGPRLIYVRSLRLRFQPAILFEGEFAAFVLSEPQQSTGGTGERD